MVVGEFVMYVFGVVWLAVDLHVGIGKAISLGFLPFWIGDAIKCALAAGLLPSAWRLRGQSATDPRRATGAAHWRRDRRARTARPPWPVAPGRLGHTANVSTGGCNG